MCASLDARQGCAPLGAPSPAAGAAWAWNATVDLWLDNGLFEAYLNSGVAILSGPTCGYFVADSVTMALYAKESMSGMGGATPYAIMWMHHVVSMLVWPYAMVARKGAVFVTYFIATEVTNVGQNLFQLAAKAELFGKGNDLYIGLVWAFTFLVVRVLPVPYILYAYVATHVLTPGGCNLGTAEYIVSLLTVPIPIALNLFWFSCTSTA